MRSSDLPEMISGLVQAESAVDCEPDFGGVGVFLTIVFPPADGAEVEALRSGQRPVSTAGAAIRRLHGWMDGIWSSEMTKRRSEHAFLIGCREDMDTRARQAATHR